MFYFVKHNRHIYSKSLIDASASCDIFILLARREARWPGDYPVGHVIEWSGFEPGRDQIMFKTLFGECLPTQEYKWLPQT